MRSRDIELLLDERPIFKGEIQKAPGMLQGAEAYAENILFTMEDEVCVPYARSNCLFRCHGDIVLRLPQSGFGFAEAACGSPCGSPRPLPAEGNERAMSCCFCRGQRPASEGCPKLRAEIARQSDFVFRVLVRGGCLDGCGTSQRARATHRRRWC